MTGSTSELFTAEEIARYTSAGQWGTAMLSDVVAANAVRIPDSAAFLAEGVRLTWSEYSKNANQLARTMTECNLSPGDRICVLLPDGPGLHVAYLAAERAGLVTVGLAVRSGQQEVSRIVLLTGARAILVPKNLRGEDTLELFDQVRRHCPALEYLVQVGEATGLPFAGPSDPTGEVAVSSRALGPHDLWFINSTSGTTGLPKCVMHTQARWMRYHHHVERACNLTNDDVVMSVVPGVYGFGLWSAHFSPALVGSPTVLMPHFDPVAALKEIERHRVTVLVAVTTQFIMMLMTKLMQDMDFSSLRVLFTGGEKIPRERAVEFEELTGAKLLTFYGSNEVGALAYTTVDDPPERRWTTCGRIIEEMNIRLIDGTGSEVRDRPGTGQPAGRGPLVAAGYYDDPEANAALYTPSGDMLMGDIVSIDGEGYLTVVGRTSDFIIRGGKNISAVAVEQEVGQHPAVAQVAAIPVADPVFGERVCIAVVPAPDQDPDLDQIKEFLRSRGVSKEWWPELMMCVSAMPISVGGKVAKTELRAMWRERDKNPADSA